jgi:soluble lytic murein transglycosylase-like protein
MAINIINPSYNLINTAQTAGAGRNVSPANAADGVTGIGQSFSDILETVVSNLQNPSAGGNAVSSITGSTVNLDAIFQKASDTYNVPVELLKAVAKAESNFDPAAESHAGAKGIMQLMPGTANALGVTDPFDPEQSIMGGAKYLSQQLARYDGNAVLALAAYNAGPGNVAKYNGVPPFKETQNYITKVMAYAGEPITAGEVSLSGASDTAVNAVAAAGTDIKDYALMMDLYRYKMQLSVLTESDPDSDREQNNLIDSLINLV